MPFLPGQSGNPSGRPKESRAALELARQHGPAAIRLLAEIMLGENKSLRVQLRDRIEAAKILLDRGYGRPVQGVELTGRDGQAIETKAVLDEAALEMIRALGERVRQIGVPAQSPPAPPPGAEVTH